MLTIREGVCWGNHVLMLLIFIYPPSHRILKSKRFFQTIPPDREKAFGVQNESSRRACEPQWGWVIETDGTEIRSLHSFWNIESFLFSWVIGP